MTRSSNAVFLSYASEDAVAAQRICAALRNAGVEVWFDQDALRGGDAWDRSIKKQIGDCALFIAVVSAHTDERDEGYFRREWWLAIERSHDLAGDTPFLLPVTIDDTAEAWARVPDAFRDVQWTRLPAAEVPAVFVEHVTRLLAAGRFPRVARSGAAVSSKPTNTASAIPPPPAATSPVTHTRRMLLPLAAVILIGAGYFTFKKLMQPAGTTATVTAVGATAQPGVPAAIPQKSIVVLPFLDMSEKHDQEYFSDGLTEELIDHLANTPELKVIARTSSFQFKGKNEDVRAIAERLGVANVLEGSVRKSDNELRVTAQLIRAADGTHLWSKTYDRELKDIFKLQDEIATTVSRALQVALNPVSRASATDTTNLEAYNLVLKGNYYFVRGNLGDDATAVSSYLEAIRLAPDYAQAWGRLARCYIWQGFAGYRPTAEAAAKAREAAQRALAIDPSNALAHYALGNVYRFYDYDWARATEEFERVQTLDPNGDEGADSRRNIASMKMNRTGRTEEYLELNLEHLARNPLDMDAMGSLAWAQQIAGQLDAAAATSRRLLEVNPRFIGGEYGHAYVLWQMGKTSEALAAAEREPDEALRLSMLACALWTLGHHTESTTAVGKLESGFANKFAYAIAMSHACRGEASVAIDWLERAHRQHDGSMQVVRIEPMLQNLRGDPRYHALLVKMNLAD